MLVITPNSGYAIGKELITCDSAADFLWYLLLRAFLPIAVPQPNT